jgi:hypothetical protein
MALMPTRTFATPPTKFGEWTVEIIKRSEHAAGFEVLSRR